MIMNIQWSQINLQEQKMRDFLPTDISEFHLWIDSPCRQTYPQRCKLMERRHVLAGECLHAAKKKWMLTPGA